MGNERPNHLHQHRCLPPPRPPPHSRPGSSNRFFFFPVRPALPLPPMTSPCWAVLDISLEPNQAGASIDRETENGLTALIGAAEEDPHAPGHAWVRNDEGWEVLAAALLLDRRIHRPKVSSTRFYFVCFASKSRRLSLPCSRLVY